MKVRLKHQVRGAASRRSRFQFHEGPIKTFSKPVTLATLLMFQFHEGPIKTNLVRFRFSRRNMFQFHEGPIKTQITFYYFCAFVLFQFHEGPIKTQFHTIEERKFLFQFHEGPIKTPSGSRLPCCCLSFNSMKVRLKQTFF